MRVFAGISCRVPLRAAAIACAFLAFSACSQEQKAQPKPVVREEAPKGGKVSQNVSFTVTEARLVPLESSDAALATRWGPVAGMLDPEFTSWKVKGATRQTVSAHGIGERKWQFARVILTFSNQGAAKDTLHLCTAEGACPNIALNGESGAAMPVWQFLPAGAYPTAAAFQSDMTRHGTGIMLRSEFKGNVFNDLLPGQRTWIAILFDAAADPGKCSLRVFDQTIPLTLAH